MSRWDSSTGTLLYLPDRSCTKDASGILAALGRAALEVVKDDVWHNPIEWLDARHQGVFIRVLPIKQDRYGVWRGWGGIYWDNAAQVEALLSVAESLTMRTVNRWYALCDYEGWDDECTQTTEVPSFEDFRALLKEMSPRAVRAGPKRGKPERLHPAECHVYRVHGPPWTPTDK